VDVEIKRNTVKYGGFGKSEFKLEETSQTACFYDKQSLHDGSLGGENNLKMSEIKNTSFN
jgi:hypothetical protein